MASILNSELMEPKEAKNISLEFDLVGFDSGIYFGRPDSSLLDLVDELPKSEKKSFIFSTRGRNRLFENAYHRTLRKRLTEKGYAVIGEFSCKGFSDYHKIFKLFGGVNKGHPNIKELDEAKTFALKLAETYGARC